MWALQQKWGTTAIARFLKRTDTILLHASSTGSDVCDRNAVQVHTESKFRARMAKYGDVRFCKSQCSAESEALWVRLCAEPAVFKSVGAYHDTKLSDKTDFDLMMIGH